MNPQPSNLPLLSVQEQRHLHSRLPLSTVDIGRGRQVAVRCAGDGGQWVVCLHGIGSGSASWLRVAQQLPPGLRLLAWDAPGYGLSTPLEMDKPTALDYARRLQELLHVLEVKDFVLVGHSLGALMAGAYARHLDQGEMQALFLMNPAIGYGRPGLEQRRQAVWDQRMAQVASGDMGLMARQRHQRLLSEQATPENRELVLWIMASLHLGGYQQAVQMLCQEDLLTYLPLSSSVPVAVSCGEVDVVTTPEACAGVARACSQHLRLVPQAGHASYVEQPGAMLEALQSLLGQTQALRSVATTRSSHEQ